MNFLSLALGFIGYTLVYAATANHGRFVTSPWIGVLADAYDPGSDGSDFAPGGRFGGGTLGGKPNSGGDFGPGGRFGGGTVK